MYAYGRRGADSGGPRRPFLHRKKSDDGLTLVELLIVVAVLGIIAAVVVFALGGVSAQGAVAACNTDAKTVETAVAAYNTETGGSPTVTADLLTEGPTPILRSFPSSASYAISIVNGEVMVAVPKGATPVPYDSANPCGNAGSSDETTTTAPESPTTTTTTTASTPTTTTEPPTTTTTTTTTDPNPANGVTVAAADTSLNTVDREVLTLNNSSSISALSITISVATAGVTSKRQGNTFPSGTMKQSSGTSGGVISYTSTLKSQKTLPAGLSDSTVYVQFKDTKNVHDFSGDTWSVTSVSDGLTSTLTGTFG